MSYLRGLKEWHQHINSRQWFTRDPTLLSIHVHLSMVNTASTSIQIVLRLHIESENRYMQDLPQGYTVFTGITSIFMFP